MHSSPTVRGLSHLSRWFTRTPPRVKDDVIYSLASAERLLAAQQSWTYYRIDPQMPGRYTTSPTSMPIKLSRRSYAWRFVHRHSNGGKLLLLSITPPTTVPYTSDVFRRRHLLYVGPRRSSLRPLPNAQLHSFSPPSGKWENPTIAGNLWSAAQCCRLPATILALRHATFSGSDPQAWRVSTLRHFNTCRRTSSTVRRDRRSGRSAHRSVAAPAPPSAVSVAFPAANAPRLSSTFRSIPIQLHSPHNAIGPQPPYAGRRMTTTAMTSSSPSSNRDVHEHNCIYSKTRSPTATLLRLCPFCPMRSTASRPRQRRSVTHGCRHSTGERISAPSWIDTTPPVPGVLLAAFRAVISMQPLDAHDATSAIAPLSTLSTPGRGVSRTSGQAL